MRRGVPLLALVLGLFCTTAGAATLEGIAVLPAHTFASGPPSGHFIGTQTGPEWPLRGQPVQGFSALITNGDGGFLALSDNGFGTRENSADFLLRIYHLEADFRTAEGGAGDIRLNGFMNLGDPDRLLHYPVLADLEAYPGAESSRAVEDPIRESRLLTGRDLDPESLRRAPDDTLWIGDETGPFLLHFNARGELLEPPYQLPGLHAEGRPDGCCPTASLPRSRGFEGMALAPDGRFLYPMLEGALADQPGQLNIYTFDLEQERFLNANARAPSFRYRLEPQGIAIGEFTLFSDTAGLVIERDALQGEPATHKRIYRVDLGRTGPAGFVFKQAVVDLLAIDDPQDLDGDGETVFAFSHQTPEALVVIDRDTIGVINDNNYPFGRARSNHEPDGTEFILITVANLW